MPLPRKAVLASLVAAAALALVPSAASALSGTIGYGSFHSTSLDGTIHYSVYLPPGYSGSATRYPVVYFIHGLPAHGSSYRSIGWVARALESSGHKAILVGAQGARAGDTDPEWHDWGSGRNWESSVAGELVPLIDGRYRTLARRSGRAIIGFSAGGYGATLIGFHHTDEFGVIQSWSGYFEPTNPAGTAVLDLGSRQANQWANMHSLVPRLRTLMGSNYARTYFSFYVGTHDRRFRADNARLEREIRAHRFPHWHYAVYSGSHSVPFWTSHSPMWIGLALEELRAPR